MASSTSSFFFKLENSELSIQDIRDFGLVAKEGLNGFVEVSISEHIIRQHIELKQVLEPNVDHRRSFEWDKEYKKNIKFLISGMKENTPPLMYLSSNSFGGMDDYPKIYVYVDEDTYSKYKDNFRDDSAAELVFSKHYPDLADGYYNSVNFVRHSDSDLISDEQKEELNKIKNQIDDILFQQWIEKQESLKIEDLAQSLIKSFESINSWNPKHEDKEEAATNVHFIKKYLALNY